MDLEDFLTNLFHSASPMSADAGAAAAGPTGRQANTGVASNKKSRRKKKKN